ncbi:MAG: aspartate aminotransferase family protein [Oleiphilaceae bacterium]|nr:aspartate aminotransferase family protein [Oleiphilaceae bacterium]
MSANKPITEPEPALAQTALARTIQHSLLNTQSLNDYPTLLASAGQRVADQVRGTERPFTGIRPGELRERFGPVDLEAPLGDLEPALEELQSLYLDDAVYFHHPRYLAHLNCPVALPAIAGEVIQASLNTAVETWDQSAGATLVEQTLIDWTSRRLGLGARADGVFTSGGTQSNLMALLLARDSYSERHWHHETRQRGLHPEAHRLRIFCSQVSHFSVQKAAATLGMGYDAVVPVPCDGYFRMDMAALENALEECRREGGLPLAVVATAGTTDFGSIDPLPAITRLCREQAIWCHVDAAYGCGLMVSPRHQHLLNGIQQADSVSVDYHKAFFQPVSCSACLVRDACHLRHLTWHAEYLNPLSQSLEGTPNLVDKSMQTTRRFDALKLWLTLRTLGPEGLGEAFDQLLHLARQGYMLLLSDEAIEVIHQPQLSTLVFRYRPEGVAEEQLDTLNQQIRKALMRSGEALIAATRVRGRQYLKFTLLNPATRIGDLQAVLRLIRRHGEAALAESRPTTGSRPTEQSAKTREPAHV